MVHLWISWLAAWVSSQFKGKESCRTRDSNEQWLHYLRIPLLKRLVVYGFISLSMHDLLGFEGYIPTRHGCYCDGKQNKRGKKPEGTKCSIGNFQIWKHILSISAMMLLAMCSRGSST